MVRLGGFEPPAKSLGSSCSILLSYSRSNGLGAVQTKLVTTMVVHLASGRVNSTFDPKSSWDEPTTPSVEF